MTQVTSSWPRIMTIINALWTKQTQNPKKIILNSLCFKTKPNNEMSDEEHSGSEFYYTEEQLTAERKASRCGRHFDNLKPF